MGIRIIFKNGFELVVKCESFTVNRNGLKEVIGFDFKGVTENKPLHLDFSEILAVVGIMSDESEQTDEKENG